MSMRVIVAGREYPPTLSTAEVAELWGCSPELLQRERETGRLPVRPLELGRRLRWPTADVAGSLGLPVTVVECDDVARVRAVKTDEPVP